MPTEEQTEWPSFDGVLQDVLPADVAERLRPESSAAAEARRRAASERAASATATLEDPLALGPAPGPVDTGSAVPDLLASVRETLDHQPVATIDSSSVEDVDPTLADALLPAPLAPLELDTSHVRALLESAPDAEPSFDVSALDDLAPATDLSDLADLTEESDLAEIPDASDVHEPETTEALELSDFPDLGDLSELRAPEPEPEVETAVEEDVELVDTEELDTELIDTEELDAELIDSEDPNAEALETDDSNDLHETEEADEPAVFQITDVDAYEFVDVVEADPTRDLYSDLPESDIGGIELPEQPAVETFDELSPDTLESIELTVDAPPTVIEQIDDTPTLDAPIAEDDELDPVDVGETADDHEEDGGAEVVELFDGSSSFDSIATADAIENELLDLDFKFDGSDAADSGEHEDNVVQLRDFGSLEPDASEEPAESEPTEADTPVADKEPSFSAGDEYASLSEAGTSWSDSMDDFALELPGEEATNSAPSFVDDPDVIEQAIVEAPAKRKPLWRGVEGAEQRADPWADMRPTEEVKKPGGWWANRPKFFGGDDRKQKKAERQAQMDQVLADAVDISFDNRCPDCSNEVSVDLDDPIGRRVHVSCDSCKTQWHTPYHVDSEAS